MFTYPDDYDVIIVGAGHAGCEAGLAAARMGARVLVLTGSLDTVAHMSCNPAIGGVAKGHIVKEIDALGGEMASVIDETGIQFRRLNSSKGPAVRSTRAQADKRRYRDLMRQRLELCPNLALRQGEVASLGIEEDSRGGDLHSGRQRVVGVETTMGVRYRSRAVILTTGTFLRGAIHVGEAKSAGGRVGEAPSMGLSGSLAKCGFPLARLKTGTPCRIDRKTIDINGLEHQPGMNQRRCFAGPARCPTNLACRKCRAGLPTPVSAPTKSFATACIARRYFAVKLKAAVHVIARASKTKLSGLRTRTVTRFSLSRKVSNAGCRATAKSIRTGFRRRCRTISRWRFYAPLKAWNMPR